MRLIGKFFPETCFVPFLRNAGSFFISCFYISTDGFYIDSLLALDPVDLDLEAESAERLSAKS
jgi:hypothetical protein